MKRILAWSLIGCIAVVLVVGVALNWQHGKKWIGVSLTLIGLAIATIGTWITVRNLSVSREQSKKVTAATYGGNTEAADSVYRQGRDASIGLKWIGVGFVFQLAGTLIGALA